MIKSSITSIKHSELETVENIFSFLFKNLKQFYRVSYEFYFLFCKQKWHSSSETVDCCSLLYGQCVKQDCSVNDKMVLRGEHEL